ncbi:flavodoxin [Proteiniphilum sp. X52]|uniref:flavodoxin n=1 Tax=Proteiniphilum sp. X52 TaxID=2382159 RepID=UPI000F09CD48|nr:flavodoxin [Proteiniphilum sp. X52]RNC67048.1 hypothetical protein D7D25_02115 [Proteiniphilum sp. X52]
MKKISILLALVLCSLSLFTTACETNPKDLETSNTENPNTETPNSVSGKTLILYYSKSGNTLSVAQTIERLIANTEMLRVNPANPYPEGYSETLPVATAEIEAIDNQGVYPPINTTIDNFNDYEMVIICSPLWWSRLATPMQSFLHANGSKLAGKKIAVAATSGATGIAQLVGDVRRLAPDAVFTGEGLRIAASQASSSQTTIATWLRSLGYTIG